MRINVAVAGVVLGLCCLGANAQMSIGSGAKAPVGTMSSPAKSLDDLLSLFEGEAMGVVKAMPTDKYGFAPSMKIFAPEQGVKFDTVRTFAEQVTHVAEANFHFYGAVSGLKPDMDVSKIVKLTKKEDIVAALAASFAFAHKAIATITPENAFLTIKPVDGINTRAAVAAFGVAHGYDHYGQMVEYLRMNGVVPPGSK